MPLEEATFLREQSESVGPKLTSMGESSLSLSTGFSLDAEGAVKACTSPHVHGPPSSLASCIAIADIDRCRLVRGVAFAEGRGERERGLRLYCMQVCRGEVCGVICGLRDLRGPTLRPTLAASLAQLARPITMHPGACLGVSGCDKCLLCTVCSMDVSRMTSGILRPTRLDGSDPA